MYCVGVARFHDLDEVVSNATRICRSTHADPQCVAASTMVSVLLALLLQVGVLTESPVTLVCLNGYVCVAILVNRIHKNIGEESER